MRTKTMFILLLLVSATTGTRASGAGYTELGTGHCVDANNHRPPHCFATHIKSDALCRSICDRNPGCTAYEWGQMWFGNGPYCQLIQPAGGTKGVCPSGFSYTKTNAANPVVKTFHDTGGGKCSIKNPTVTFRVDMQKTKAEPSGVYVAGPIFNSPTGQKMSDANNDGIYELTVSLPANTQYQFKFRNGKHDAWSGPGWEGGLSCGVGQYKDRAFPLGTVALVIGPFCFNSCKPCPPSTRPKHVFTCKDPKASNYLRTKDGSNKCLYWRPFFNDEFSEAKLSPAVWERLEWDVGVVNNELQRYTTSEQNSFTQDGKLTIRATHSVNGAGKSEYSSARLVTAGAVDFLNGRVDVRARLPAGTGTWPAIWLLPTDWSYGEWPASGEIDIMEMVGRDLDVVHGTVHTAAYNHNDNTGEIGATGGRIVVPESSTSYHVYSLVWTPDHLTFLVDDEAYHRYHNDGKNDFKTWPFNKRHHIILNVAMGGGLGGPVDDKIFQSPVQMDVDFVRIYQQKGTNENPDTVVRGCTDPMATNWKLTAVQDDGSCLYQPSAQPSSTKTMPSTVVGCTKSGDRNFNPKAQFGRNSIVCAKIPVTFRVDMQKTKAEPSGVYVAGPIFDSPTGQKMSDANNDGIYELTVNLPANTQYQFKFRNGKHDAWSGPGWEGGLSCGVGQYKDRTFPLGTVALVIGPFCFNSCSLCPKATVAPTTTKTNRLLRRG